VKVLILCGGFGTRLTGAAGELPKPMIPVGERPIVWHIMKGLAHWGFSDFVLCLGYRSDMFRHYFLNLPAMLRDVTIEYRGDNARITHAQGEEHDWRVVLADTGLYAMTAHRIRCVAHYLEDDELFGVTYGDGVTDLDFQQVVDFHRSHGRLATVTAVRPPGRFGELGVDARGAVRQFNEKPQAEDRWISGGFFVFSRRVLDRLSDDPGLVLEHEPLQSLAADGQLMAYFHHGFWLCVDTPRDYEQLTQRWASGCAPWAVWKSRAAAGLREVVHVAQ
jgi:glucose-1-phosphate cytidylyltransferase